jgi:TolB-like protein
MELWRGVLIDDVSIRGEAFEEWLRTERDRLKSMAIGLFDQLVPVAPETERIEIARRLIALDPLREASHRQLMRAYAGLGERALALKHYDALRRTLRDELAVEPAEETQRLRRAIADEAVATPAGATLPERPSGSSIADGRPSMAVLPFANLSGDPQQDYFADRISEDLTTDLSKARELFVIAAQTMLRYRGIQTDPLRVARDLGIRYVVHGSVRKVSDELRLNAQLLDAESGAICWADRFDRHLSNIHEVQTQLVRGICGSILGAATSSAEPAKYHSPSLEAYDLCMRGRAAFRISEEMEIKARPLFERAIQLDPNYSEAYRLLAEIDSIVWLFYEEKEQPWRTQALLNANLAVEKDPMDASAYGTLGFVLLYERRWEESAKAFETALSLNPNDADAWLNSADLHVMEGRSRIAVECARRALKLNPRPFAFYYWELGNSLYTAGEYEEVIRVLRREETYRTESRRILAAALAMLGRTEEAREEAHLFRIANPRFTIKRWVETQPFRDIATRDRFIEGFRKAGLPEGSDPPRSQADPRPSIAVLPFANLGAIRNSSMSRTASRKTSSPS